MLPKIRALVLTALLAPAPLRAQEFEAGALAPPGRWTVAGGAASRSGRSLAPALRREPEVAWRLVARGAIEGEPRVLDGQVTIAVREGPGRRALQTVELETGRTLLHQVLPATTPLEPALWSDRVCVRPSENRVDVYRARAGRLFLLRSIQGRASVSPPLVVDGELYLRVDDALVRYDLDRREPVWTATPDAKLRGTPSLRGDGVTALLYDERGNAHLGVFARADGRLLSAVLAGHHGGAVPAVEEDATLTLLTRDAFVRYPRAVETADGRRIGFGRVPREGLSLETRGSSLESLLTPPTGWGDGWLTLERADGEPRWVTAERVAEGARLQVLADARNHAALTQHAVPAARTGDVVYLAGLACDLTTGRILWRRDAPLVRPVPADGTLLVVERADTLLALREPERPPSSAEARAAEADAQVRAEVAEGYALLAHRSLRLGDAGLTRRLVGEAVRRGARGRTLDAARDGLERLAGAPPRTADPRRRAALEAEEAELVGRPPTRLVELAHEAGDPALRRALLRAALGHDRVHVEAARTVARLVPREAPRTSSFDALRWLDFLDVAAETPLSFVHAGEPGPDTERLLAQRWRSDVVGYRSERVLVLSRPGRPGAVARCLEVGELVCDLLEEIFGAGQAQDAEPMTLLLFETQREYVEQSLAAKSMPEAALGWTAGHYSGADDLSRLYVPEDDDGLERLLGVYAHELTHHWLASRSPFASRRSDPELPFWVVEGVATLVEEFVLEPSSGTWSPINPRAESLDVVANASELLPWDRVLTLSHREFAALDAQPETSCALQWKLGSRAQLSEVQLFYAQSGAVCHLLFSRSRERLVEQVRAWYRRERAPSVVADGLGEQVVAFARERVR